MVVCGCGRPWLGVCVPMVVCGFRSVCCSQGCGLVVLVAVVVAAGVGGLRGVCVAVGMTVAVVVFCGTACEGMGHHDVQESANNQPFEHSARGFRRQDRAHAGPEHEAQAGDDAQHAKEQQSPCGWTKGNTDAEPDGHPVCGHTDADGKGQSVVDHGQGGPVDEAVHAEQDQGRARPKLPLTAAMEKCWHARTQCHAEEGPAAAVGQRVGAQVEESDAAHQGEHQSIYARAHPHGVAGRPDQHRADEQGCQRNTECKQGHGHGALAR